MIPTITRHVYDHQDHSLLGVFLCITQISWYTPALLWEKYRCSQSISYLTLIFLLSLTEAHKSSVIDILLFCNLHSLSFMKYFAVSFQALLDVRDIAFTEKLLNSSTFKVSGLHSGNFWYALARLRINSQWTGFFESNSTMLMEELLKFNFMGRSSLLIITLAILIFPPFSVTSLPAFSYEYT